MKSVLTFWKDFEANSATWNEVSIRMGHTDLHFQVLS